MPSLRSFERVIRPHRAWVRRSRIVAPLDHDTPNEGHTPMPKPDQNTTVTLSLDELRALLERIDINTDETRDAHVGTPRALRAAWRKLDKAHDALKRPQTGPWFSWVAELTVHKTWIEDGFELTDDRALDMLARDLSYADIGAELRARVLSAPDAERIATTQGYKSAADRAESDRVKLAAIRAHVETK